MQKKRIMMWVAVCVMCLTVSIWSGFSVRNQQEQRENSKTSSTTLQEITTMYLPETDSLIQIIVNNFSDIGEFKLQYATKIKKGIYGVKGDIIKESDKKQKIETHYFMIEYGNSKYKITDEQNTLKKGISHEVTIRK